MCGNVLIVVEVTSELAMTDLLHPAGGRSSQAIVDGAMNALRTLVKDRMSGKSGGSSYKQVEEHVNKHI